jgi:hypothetical protein
MLEQELINEISKKGYVNRFVSELTSEEAHSLVKAGVEEVVLCSKGLHRSPRYAQAIWENKRQIGVVIQGGYYVLYRLGPDQQNEALEAICTFPRITAFEGLSIEDDALIATLQKKRHNQGVRLSRFNERLAEIAEPPQPALNRTRLRFLMQEKWGK